MAEINWDDCPHGAAVKARLEDLIKLVEKQNGSVGTLQKFMWVCIGGLGLLGIVFGSMKFADFLKLLGG
jgi:hypothetical protein